MHATSGRLGGNPVEREDGPFPRARDVIRRLARSPRWQEVGTASWVVAIVSAAVFVNSMWNGFAFDDHHIIVNNPEIHDLDGLPRAILAPYWPTAFGRDIGLWRPATTGSFGLLYALGGGSPVPFHVANVLGHVAVSVLVLRVLARLMPIAAALTAALVFAVHPVHVEAVANAVGLAEILSTAAVMGACLIHLRAPRPVGWRYALAIGVLYAIGFGAKESAATLPGLILLLDAARSRLGFGDLPPYLRDTWRPYLAMLIVGVLVLASRLAILGTIASPFGPLGAQLLEDIPRIWTLGEVWTHYVRLWAFPLDLAADYAPNLIPISTGWHPTNIVGVALALALMLITWILWRRPEMDRDVGTARAAAFGITWFVIAIAPISNVLFLSGVLLAERTLYLPSVGLAAASGWLVVRLARERPRIALLALAAALTFGAARTWTRTPVWRDNPTLLTNLVEEYPQSGRSQWILGDAFLSQGRVSEALRAYRATIGVLDTDYVVMVDVAKQLMKIERYRAAEVLLTLAWRDAPRFAAAPGTLAGIRAELGDAAGTERWARASLAIERPDPLRSQLLAWALAAQGRWEQAELAHRAVPDDSLSTFWHTWLYEAYAHRTAGDTAGMAAALDSAWAKVGTAPGRQALDSIRVNDFGLAPLLNETGARQAPDGSS